MQEERSCVSLSKLWSAVDRGDSVVVFLVWVVELWLLGRKGLCSRRPSRSCCVIEELLRPSGVAAYVRCLEASCKSAAF